MAIVLVWGLITAPGAPGYKFYSRSERSWWGPFVPVADEAVRWDPAIWPPGGTLSFGVVDEPGWTEPGSHLGEPVPAPFEDVADAVPFIRDGFAAWSEIGSADIGWRISGVVGGEGRARDGRNTVGVDPAGEVSGYARIWMDRGAGGWNITECDIAFSPAQAGYIRHNDYLVRHESGHCLGLDHPGTWIFAQGSRLGLWVWSTQVGAAPPVPPLDDIVGASLLRPAKGWVDGTGNIVGSVTVAGAPGAFLQVVATVLGEDGAVRGSGIQILTNAEGDFTIEGLVAGRYVLYVGAIQSRYTFQHFLEAGAVTDVRNRFVFEPIAVRPGRTTRAARIDLLPGRTQLTWPRP